MKTYIILGIILSIIGFYGTLSSSSIFFGLLASGVFLIAYSLLTEKGGEKLETPTSQTSISTAKPQSATPIPAFCPSCGAKLESKTSNCPFCGKRLGEEA